MKVIKVRKSVRVTPIIITPIGLGLPKSFAKFGKKNVVVAPLKIAVLAKIAPQNKLKLGIASSFEVSSFKVIAITLKNTVRK